MLVSFRLVPPEYLAFSLQTFGNLVIGLKDCDPVYFVPIGALKASLRVDWIHERHFFALNRLVIVSPERRCYVHDARALFLGDEIARNDAERASRIDIDNVQQRLVPLTDQLTPLKFRDHREASQRFTVRPAGH